MKTLTKLSLATLALALLTTTGAQAQMKVPAGCVPAEGAASGVEQWADRVIHEQTGIELVLVPPGSFTMGSTFGYSNVIPLREVSLAQPFYLGRYPVTNAQYRRFAEATDYDGEADTDPAYDLYLRHWRGESLMSAEDEYPVVWVSWHNAQAFCAWAGLALPSEAQWEYAARAGTTTLYYHGTDDPNEFEAIGWALPNSEGLTHPVGLKEPNAWGLYDMLGNVWDWCEDDYIYQYHDAPLDGSPRLGEPRKLTRVLRGGSWSNTHQPMVCSVAARFNSAPGNASNDTGFRVALPVQ